MSGTADFMRRSIDMEPPIAARGHMPFLGHRMMKEVWADDAYCPRPRTILSEYRRHEIQLLERAQRERLHG